MSTTYRFHAPLLALVLLATACSTDQTTPTQDSGIDPAEEAALADAASGAQVQLSSLRGYHIRLYQSSCKTSSGAPVFGPNGFSIEINGLCTLGHFGAAELAATQQVVFNPDGSQSLHNESAYTFPGGDVLYSVFDGTGASTGATTVSFEAWERFTGGTGRFEHARGGAKARGSADLATAQGEYRTLGVIGY